MSIARLCLLLALFLLPLLGGQAGISYAWDSPQSHLLSLTIFAVLSTAGWLGWASSRPRPACFAMPLRWPLVALGSLTFATMLLSVYRPASVLALWQFIVVVSLALLAAVMPLDRRQLGLGVLAFAAGVLASVLIGLHDWATWFQAKGLLDWRVQSTWENANFYAAFLLISLPLLAGAAVLLSRGWRWAVAGVIALGLAALVLTQSRGALLAFLPALLAMGPAWLWATGKLSRRGLGLLAVGLLVFIGLALASPLGKRVLDPETRATQLHSQMFRYYTWVGSVRMVQAAPVCGVGPGAFASAFGQYQVAGYTRHAHHSYLQAAAEMGVLGGVALVWLFVGALALCRRLLKTAELPGRLVAAGLLGGTVGLLLHGLVDPNWLYPGVQLTLLLGAVLAWRLRPEAGASCPIPVLPRVLIPLVMMIVTGALVLGARAEQQFKEGEALIKLAMTAETKDAQATYYQNAMSAFERALGLAPTHARYLRTVAVYSPPDVATRYLTKAQKVERTNPANWQYAGNLLLQQARYTDAAKAYAVAEHLQPRLLSALYGQARALSLAGDRAGARQALQRLLATRGSLQDRYYPVEVPEPWFTLAWYAEGVLAARDGDADTSHKAFQMTLAAAAAYEQGFTLEAEAVAQQSGSEFERAKMQALAATAAARLGQHATGTPLPKKDWGEAFP